MSNYDDIINLPHWEPKTHPRMSMQARAAQFAPFAALVGHQEAIDETARLTDAEIELDASDLSTLNRRMALLADSLSTDAPSVTVTYFLHDTAKAGGAYITHTGIPKKIDEYDGELIFADSTRIKLCNIISIDGPIFDNLD